MTARISFNQQKPAQSWTASTQAFFLGVLSSMSGHFPFIHGKTGGHRPPLHVVAAVVWLVFANGAALAQGTAGVFGNTAIWKVFTADTLPPGRASVSTTYDRIHRNPGDLSVNTTSVAAAAGLTNRLEFGFALEANKQVVVGRPDQLSFGQQALGFFGNKTPGSPPLPEELVAGSSRMPQLRTPPAPTGRLSGVAGYYNLLPFAGLVREGSGIGLATLALKFNVLSEASGAPVGLAARGHFDIPIRKGIDYLLQHPVGTADLQYGFEAIVSRSVHNLAELYWNLGYRHINQPVHVSIVRLADEAPLGFGWNIPRRARIQFVGETTAEVFIGSRTPAAAFGAADPADLALGVRAGLLPRLTVTAGYRRELNKTGGDRNGFVIQAAFGSSTP